MPTTLLFYKTLPEPGGNLKANRYYALHRPRRDKCRLAPGKFVRAQIRTRTLLDVIFTLS
ncbi:MAG TPA: hypothetical protein VN379_03320 [Sporomusa sp.]|nr:hypothetical protein [Sporomusa sp.]